MNTRLCALLLGLWALSACAAYTQDAAPQNKLQEQTEQLLKKIAELEQRLEESDRRHEEEIAALRAKIEEMSGAANAPEASAAMQKLIEVSYDVITTTGWSSADGDLIDALQRGDHDPKARGFSIRNLEFSLTGAVDPFFNGEAHTVFKLDPVSGETETEVEEAFLTTTSLPNSMEVKAGQFFTQFGRLNPRHPHTWNFVDQPVVLSRLLGPDGLRNPGAQLSWVTPLRWYSELFLTAQNATGETAESFLGSEGPGDTPVTDRSVRSLGDMLYSARWLNSWDLTDEKTLNLGFSGAFGPNNTGPTNRTQILGTDIFYKWKPRVNDHGFPFLSLQAEALYRNFQAGGVSTDRRDLKDWGAYAELNYGYQRNWVAGLRVDYANANGDNSADPLRAKRLRLSPALTWYPSEFSRFRLQFNFDQSDFLARPEHSVWLQYEIGFGAHPAHKF